MSIASAWAEGRRLFEAGEYWECHEALEGAWLRAEGTERAFLAGVILLAAALHKARTMRSARGGRRNYAKALRRLAVVPDVWYGVDVRELEARVHRALRDPEFRPMIPRAPGGTVPSDRTSERTSDRTHDDHDVREPHEREERR